LVTYFWQQLNLVKMEITTSLQEVNCYQLLSDTINDTIGNTGNQTDAVYDLFVSGLFCPENNLKCQVIQDANGNSEYHIDFDGFSNSGKSPADALSKVLWDMSAEISSYRNGTP
jgi:hypothetical protein